MNPEAIMVPIRVTLCKVASGETRTFDDELYTTADYDGLYIWEDGNYGCDCNRYLFWERAGGREPFEEGDELHCGSSEYRVDQIVRVSDGAVLYTEITTPSGVN